MPMSGRRSRTTLDHVLRRNLRSSCKNLHRCRAVILHHFVPVIVTVYLGAILLLVLGPAGGLALTS
ncbi:hypothetical protein BDN67DRAFT_69861 [Paxillus ammoniavirescens]|nr:hypothetical protein BDN67DRAFT_69861 [Paxillus ammoniavirescens]